MNRMEMGTKKPDNFVESWPGQYTMFSHLEYACGIPNLLFAVTTVKENGQPNVCFHSWSTFCGDAHAFHALLGALGQYSHTYKNILRTNEFVVNFLSRDYYDNLQETIRKNSEDQDEFEAGGFTAEKAETVDVPRIKEAFLCLECKLDQTLDLSGAGIISLIIGRVTHMAMQAEYALGIDQKYGDKGFMFNIHAPKNLATGEGKTSGVAILDIVRKESE